MKHAQCLKRKLILEPKSAEVEVELCGPDGRDGHGYYFFLIFRSYRVWKTKYTSHVCNKQMIYKQYTANTDNSLQIIYRHIYEYAVSQNVTPFPCYNDKQFGKFLQNCCWEKNAIKWCFIFPPHLPSAFALSDEKLYPLPQHFFSAYGPSRAELNLTDCKIYYAVLRTA